MRISDWSSDVCSSDLGCVGGGLGGRRGDEVAVWLQHGASVVEVTRDPAGKWGVVQGSRFNRRIKNAATEIRVAGPAAGQIGSDTRRERGCKYVQLWVDCVLVKKTKNTNQQTIS